MELYLGQFVGLGPRSKVKVTMSKNILMDISVELLFIGGDAKKATEEYGYRYDTGCFQTVCVF